MAIKCSACGEWKDPADFHRRRSRPSGRRTDCKSCRSAHDQKWNTPDERLKRRYGLSLADVQAMHADQKGECPICWEPLAPPPSKNTHVDHDHATGAVRGLLCSECNMGLGKFKDSPRSLRRAIYYLEEDKSE